MTPPVSLSMQEYSACPSAFSFATSFASSCRRKSPARRDVRMRREKVCREARAYFRSQDSRPWSYEWICLVLDIDPDPMRARLSAILAKELQRLEAAA